jgi:HSP20 family protein
MQRLFESEPSNDRSEAAAAGVFPPLNVTQDANNYYVRAEVPGIKASELSISAVRNQLTIAGKREIPPEQGHVSYHRRERAEGAFNRTLTLPTELDADRVDARCVDGILTLTLPKTEAAKPRQVVVKS